MLNGLVLIFLMKSFLFVLSFFLMGPSLLHAQRHPIKLTLTTGYQEDDFQWSIAGNRNGTSPNILSELIWSDLRGSSLHLKAEVPVWKKLLLMMDYRHTFFLAGRVNDADYAENNRTNPTFQKDFLSNKGTAMSYSIAAGYQIKLKKSIFKPLIGFSHYAQALYLQDEKLLNSLYQTRWQGVMIGFEFVFSITDFLVLESELIYHQVDYKATANWNLVTYFAHPVSFRHSANGFGANGGLRAVFLPGRKFQPFIGYEFEYWRTGAGTDELYYASGDKAITRLNKVERWSMNFVAGLHFRFSFSSFP